MKNEPETLSVISVKSETPDIKSIFVKVDAASGLLHRKPGQYGMVSLRENNNWSPPHPFTFSNPPENETLRFTIKNVDQFTGKLHSLAPGDLVGIKGPLGTFCSTIEASKSVIMIAGESGITPFLSVLRYYAKNTGLKKTTLFWGNKTGDDFFSLHEFDSFHFFMDFSAIMVSEKPFLPKHLRHNRVTTLKFEDGLLTADLMKRHVDFRNCNVLVCGPDAMQGYVHEQLLLCGVEEGCIETEKFGG